MSSWFRNFLQVWLRHRSLKHFLRGIAAGEKEGNQVRNFILLQRIEQAFRHERNRGRLHLRDVCSFNDGELASDEHVLHHAHRGVRFLRHPARDSIAVLLHHDRCDVEAADLLAGFDDVLEQVTDAESAAHAGQIRSHSAAVAPEMMAQGTGRLCVKLLAPLEAPLTFESLVYHRDQLVDRPVFDEGSSGRCLVGGSGGGLDLARPGRRVRFHRGIGAKNCPRRRHRRNDQESLCAHAGGYAFWPVKVSPGAV